METNISYPKGGTSISTNSSNTRQLIVSPREKKQDTKGLPIKAHKKYLLKILFFSY